MSKTHPDQVLSTLSAMITELLPVVRAEEDLQVPLLDLGANSLTFMELARTIEKQFGTKIVLRQFFEELTTIEALATYLTQHLRATPPAETVTIATVPPSEPAPLPVNGSTVTCRGELPSVAVAPSSPPVNQPGGTTTPLYPSPTTVAGAPLAPPEIGYGRVPASSVEQLLTSQFQLSQTLSQIALQQLELLRRYPQWAAPSATSPATPASAVTPTASTVATPVAAPAWKTSTHLATQELTATQQRHLDTLVARYTRRTQNSKQQEQTYRSVFTDMRAVANFRLETKEMAYPIISKSSKGSRFWDVDGNEYIDLAMGFGVNLFGHQPDFIVQVLETQLKQGIQVGPQSELAGEVAQLISDLTGMSQVTFCNSGTEAVMTALRVARAATGRSKIVMFAGAYHGHFDGTLAVAAPRQLGAVPMVPGVLPAMVNDVLVLPYGTPQTLQIIKAQAHELAAVLVEPVQSRQPQLQPKEFLQELRELTKLSGTALIFDEMITGFRIHPGGAQAWFGVKADLVTYGKIIGGGMPLGVVAGTTHYMSRIDGGPWQYGDASYPQVERTFYAGTFCKHPLAMAAARAVLTHLKTHGPGLQAQLNQRTTAFANTLNDFFRDSQVPLQVVNFGSLFRFILTGNLSYAYQPLEMDLFFYHLIDKGIYTWELRTCYLSTAHTEADLDSIIQAVKATVAELRADGFFPTPSSATPSLTAAVAPPSVPTTLRAPAVPTTLPLTDAQKQLWVLTKLDAEGWLAYNVYLSVQLKGPLHLTTLRDAFQQVVNRHEALRMILSDNGETQHCHPTLPLEMPLVDWSGRTETELNEWFQQQGRQPFNLSKGPPLRIHLIRLAEQQHLLALAAPHILVDGWSMGIILSEGLKLYAALRQGSVCQLPSPKSWSEYLLWQHQQHQNPAVLSTHEAYWLTQFADSLPGLNWPTDRLRPVKTYQANRYSHRFDSQLTQRLKQFSQAQGYTVFMTLLAAYQLLLHRLANQDEIVVGVPVSGRWLEGSETLVGYAVNLLPLRHRVSGNPRVLEYLRELRTSLFEAYEHQEYPYAFLLKKLSARQDLTRTPLVSATFNMERPITLPQVSELEVKLWSQPIQYAAADLHLNITDLDDQFIVDCDYNTDLFDTGTIKRWVGHFQTLLEAMVAQPQQSIFQLPLLTAQERHQLLVEWNATDADFPQDQCLHHFIEEQVERTPEAVALVFEDQKLTYREYNNRANQLGRFLQDQGVGPGQAIPVFMTHSLEAPVAFLAIMKTGAAYVPLDINWPSARVKTVIEKLNTKLVLVNRHSPELPALSAPVMVVEDLWMKLASPSHTVIPNLDVKMTSTDPVYIVFTSGSTGEPKGAINHHRGIINRLWYNTQRYNTWMTPGISLLTSYNHFDAAIEQLFWPLMNGACTVIPSQRVGFEPRLIMELIAKEQVTYTEFVPSMLEVFLENATDAAQKLRFLRFVIMGGEPMNPKRISQLQSHCPGISIINAYGPAECSIGGVFYELPNPCPPTMVSVPVGRPIANVKIFILDKHQNPTPIGVPGEIYIGGLSVGMGYINNPTETQWRFINHRLFEDVECERFYRTGDLARYRSDGNIEFLGRIDHQVKLRGFRIELGEIEAMLGQHPQVRDNAVLLQETTTDKRLVAYIIPQGPVEGGELRTFLAERLPEYMIPSAWVILETLPLTSNGKLDRRALLKLEVASYQTSAAADFVAPQTEVEKAVAAIWADLLQVEKVGVHDNFFALGGHSLLAVQVVSRLRDHFNIELPVRQLFDSPTIAELRDPIERLRPLATPATATVVREVLVL